ncbi:MAG TPA: Ig-like domain-containing protein [Kofleriaceae bacterium]|nr:Ig-like domain-containing protein [Kofleriaceae bacterium]
MKLRGLVIGVLLLGPSIASADVKRIDDGRINIDGTAPLYGFTGDYAANGMILARQVLPASTTPAVSGVHDGTNVAVIAQSRIVYLNKNGVTLSPGDNDSRTNKSTIVTQTTTLPAWNVSAANWDATVSCMRDLFSRFDVSIVDQDPGNVPHIEAVFGGSPTQVGMDANTAGVSPFTLDCGIIENSIVFTFTGAFQLTSREACEIMAQEVAHSFGLDHEYLASDPMTYLDYTGNRAFQDQTSQCGEYAARTCGINGSTCRNGQNSVALLKERLGTADAISPTMAWSSPANGATVPPGFEVHASGTDNLAVMSATLRIDGTQTDMKTGPGPYVFVTSSSLAEGSHTIVVEISDGKNLKSETRTVTVKKGAPPPQDPGSGTGGTGSGSDLDNGDIVGGCTAGGGQMGALLAFGLVGLLRRRRR